MKNRRNELTMLASAVLFAGGAAFAQSPALTQPNNSAGTPTDVPRLHMPEPLPAGAVTPMRTESAQSAFGKLDPNGRGYVTRDDIDRLPDAQTIPFDAADRNKDGRLDATEFQRAWNGYGDTGQ